jgi:hypothetical protein
MVDAGCGFSIVSWLAACPGANVLVKITAREIYHKSMELKELCRVGLGQGLRIDLAE